MKVRDIIKVTKGRLASGSPGAEIDPLKISTDSRTIKRGDFFIALKGPNFDGNGFVSEIFEKGAAGALVERCETERAPRAKIVIQVKDTAKALQAIAHHHRMKFRIPVIAVTGSNGKTTVKEMIWSVLSSKYEVLKSEGTKNNHIGIPQTLLKLRREHDLCVLELGTNHKGELRNLAAIATPSVCVITNIGPSHLEFFKNLEGVYRAKIEMLASLKRRKGLAILNGDDEFLSRIRNRQIQIIRFGLKEANALKGRILAMEKNKTRFIVDEEEEFELNVLGVHNVYNALAAIAAARNFNIGYAAIKRALSDYKPTRMRLDVRKIDGIDIIDDSYNSNPASMKRALEVMESYPARHRYVVSADMLELGKDSIYFHKMIGEEAARLNIKGLLTFGELSKHTFSRAITCGMERSSAWHCSTKDEIAAILKRVAEKGDVVLIKGSRGMRMEEVLEKLPRLRRSNVLAAG